MAEDKGLAMDNQTFIASSQEGQQNAETTDVEKETATVSTEAVVEPEPVAVMREDQVKTAVSFLSHPKVRGSPIQYRRSFLEKKGLTKDEIDEAFRRVPDPSPSEAATAAAASSPAAPSTPASSVRSRMPPPPPAGVTGSPPAGLGVSTSPTAFPHHQAQSLAVGQQPQQYALQPLGPSTGQMGQMMMAQPMQVAAASPPSRSHWAQIAIAVALLGTAGAGAAVVGQKVLFPRFQAWLRHVVLGEEAGREGGNNDVEQQQQILAPKRTPAEEAALSAAAAATSIAAAVQEMVKSRSDDSQRLDHIATTMKKEMQELRATLVESMGAVKEATSAELREEMRTFALGMGGYPPTQIPAAGRQTLPVASVSAGSGHTGFISTAPVSSTDLAADTAAAYQMGRAIRGGRSGAAPDSTKAELSQAPHSASYLEVMDMLQRGEKPPNIREVNDKPPNPSQPPSNSQLAPRVKPWERSPPHALSSAQVSSVLGASTQPPGGGTAPAADSGAPWWRARAPTEGHVAAPNSSSTSGAGPVSYYPNINMAAGRSTAPSTSQPSTTTSALDSMPPPQSSSYQRPASPMDLRTMGAASSSAVGEGRAQQEEGGRPNGGSAFESSVEPTVAMQRREEPDMIAGGSGTENREAGAPSGLNWIGEGGEGGGGSSFGSDRPVGKAGWKPPSAPATVMPGAMAAIGYKSAEPAVLSATPSESSSSFSNGVNGKPAEAVSSEEAKEVGGMASSGMVDPSEGPAEEGGSNETMSKNPSYKDAALAEPLP